MRRTEFVTRLSVEECSRRLRARCAGWRRAFVEGLSMRVDPEHPVIGRVSDRGFSLFLRISYRNSFQTEVVGRLVQEGTGTRVAVRFGMSVWTIVFEVIWVAFVVAGGIALLRAPEPPESPWMRLVPLYMLLFMVALVAYGRWLARNEQQQLTMFLKRELEASGGMDATPIE